MAEFKSLVGMTFGKLTVLDRAENRGKHIYYLCKCDCGNTKEVRNDKLVSGQTNNCGCVRKKRSDCRYDARNSKLYHVYTAMKQRCFNSRCKAYKNYGGRGITVCDEWLGKEGFDCFEKWAYENGYQEGLTIDRKNVNKNYEPGNCRWITIQQQQYNTTRSVILECNGESHTLREWSKIRNIRYSRITKRYRSGWSPEEILEYKERGSDETK